MIVIKKVKSVISQDDRELPVTLQNIWLTRGDSAYITLNIQAKDRDGHEYELTENDIIRVQVRDEPTVGNLIFEGEIIRDEDIVWHINPADTANQAVGMYYWDGEVVLANGDTFSFVPVSEFHIIDEVSQINGGA